MILTSKLCARVKALTKAKIKSISETRFTKIAFNAALPAWTRVNQKPINK